MAIHTQAARLISRCSALAALLCIFCPALASAAETVETKLPTGVTATALYHKGRPTQPAVLLLHGFLQTHHSQPLNTLAGNLASKGYTVLSPTMSLGINRRNQSMACEAVHTHTISEEVAELDHWVKWLSSEGYKNIVLTGFSSTGNNVTLIYNAQGSHPTIKRSILISPNPAFRDNAEWQRTLGRVSASGHSNGKKLERFSLGYCKNIFAATAKSYLSYVQYDDNKIYDLIRQTPVRTEIILGSDDTILPANWLSRIKAQKAQVTVIDKANHFFDGTYEFDLAEKVENILRSLHDK